MNELSEWESCTAWFLIILRTFKFLGGGKKCKEIMELVEEDGLSYLCKENENLSIDEIVFGFLWEKWFLGGKRKRIFLSR